MGGTEGGGGVLESGGVFCDPRRDSADEVKTSSAGRMRAPLSVHPTV